MEALVPLPVVVPLLGAILLLGLRPVLTRWAADLLALAAGGVTVGVCVVLAAGAGDGVLVHWFGGWTPVDGVVRGIAFAVDATGAGVAAFAGFVTVTALLYSWKYFEATGPFYHVLMLVLLAGLAGFSLTGDLFGFFLFLELMVVSVYALTAYEVEAAGPLLGALNLGVASSVGASLVLVGIALLYGRTGALNLAEVGRALAGSGADLLLVTSLAALMAGLFVKIAVVPFHFAHMDALTEGPTPVVILLGGAVAPVTLLGLARIHWVVFDPAFGPATDGLRHILLGLAGVTVIVATAGALAEGGVKRLLAFVGVAHVGLGLLGMGLLDSGALAGSGIYLLSHGGVLGGLFALSGVLLHHRETTRERKLHGRGGGLVMEGTLFLAGGLALAGLPPFGLHAGEVLVSHAARTAGAPWIHWAFLLVGVFTGGAVLRVAGRAFFGLGPSPREEAAAEEETEEDDLAEQDEEEEVEETRGSRGRTPRGMLWAAAALLVSGLLAGVVPGAEEGARRAASSVTDGAGYAAAVLDGAARRPGGPVPPPPATSWITGILGAAGALLVALIALFAPAVGRPAPRGAVEGARTIGALLGRLHRGHAGDYVTWATLGTAVVGWTLVLLTLS